MNALITLGCTGTRILNWFGEWLPHLGLRFLLAWEFWEAGINKFHGENWFAAIQDRFPAPFDAVPPELSWLLAMWTEILGAIALLIGLATRFAAAGLIILDIVAWTSVHADNGYNVCSNGFKLPLMYLILLLPLLFMGPGKASLDHFITRRLCHK